MATVTVSKNAQVTLYRLARELDGNAVTSVGSVINWFQRHDIEAYAEGQTLLISLNGEIAAYKCDTVQSLQNQLVARKDFSKAVMVKEGFVVDIARFNYWLYLTAFGEEYDQTADDNLKHQEKHRRLCAKFQQMLQTS